MSQPVRRVVTGHDSQGRAVFVSDTLVEPVVTALSPATAFHQVWGGDGPPTFPDDGTRPVETTYFPPVGGFRFGLFTLPPANEPHPGPEVDIAGALDELNAALPGLFDYNEAVNPGMHTTPTIDFEVVLSGEVVLELDDGATVHLRPGDTVVQNGTRHRWSNPGDVPSTLAVFSAVPITAASAERPSPADRIGRPPSYSSAGEREGRGTLRRSAVNAYSVGC